MWRKKTHWLWDFMLPMDSGVHPLGVSEWGLPADTWGWPCGSYPHFTEEQTGALRNRSPSPQAEALCSGTVARRRLLATETARGTLDGLAQHQGTRPRSAEPTPDGHWQEGPAAGHRGTPAQARELGCPCPATCLVPWSAVKSHPLCSNILFSSLATISGLVP